MPGLVAVQEKPKSPATNLKPQAQPVAHDHPAPNLPTNTPSKPPFLEPIIMHKSQPPKPLTPPFSIPAVTITPSETKPLAIKKSSRPASATPLTSSSSPIVTTETKPLTFIRPSKLTVPPTSSSSPSIIISPAETKPPATHTPSLSPSAIPLTSFSYPIVTAEVKPLTIDRPSKPISAVPSTSSSPIITISSTETKPLAANTPLKFTSVTPLISSPPTITISPVDTKPLANAIPPRPTPAVPPTSSSSPPVESVPHATHTPPKSTPAVPPTSSSSPTTQPILCWNHITHPEGPDTANGPPSKHALLTADTADMNFHPTSEMMKCRSYKRLRKNAPPPLVSFSATKNGPRALPAKAGTAPYSLPLDHYAALPTPVTEEIEVASEANTEVPDDESNKSVQEGYLDSSVTILEHPVWKTSLNKSFPSIFHVYKLLRQSTDRPDEFRALAQQFMVMVDQVADIIETFPKPNNESYLVQYDVALLGVTFIGDIFRSSINMYYDTKKPDEIAKKLPGTLALLQTLLNNLQHFFIFASPPPALVVKGPPVACSDEGHSSSSDTASISPSTKSSKSLKFWKSSKSLRSLSGSKSSLFAFRSKTAAASTVTPSEPVPELPMRVDLSKPKDKEEMVLSRYRPRQSAIYLPSDPLYPKFDVEMPMPSGEAAAVMASQDGGIQAGTLYALVNILTSNGCVAGSQFYKTFFIGFRLFSTSHQFLDELMRRYEQPLPLEEWNQAQQRVAEREALLIRTRVVKVVMDWLHVHWVPEEDGEVLSSMLQFVDIVANGGLFPQKTVDRLAQEVQKRANGDYVIPKHKQYRCLSLQCAPDCKVADFNFPENYSTGSVYEHLMKFNSPLGWQEFAKQITAHASELFQEIKPEDLVMYWRVKQESNKFRRPLQEAKRSNEALARFESGLCIWVPSTIVLLEERVSRANLIVFWLEVATICVDLRNFCSACAIHTGLMKSAVTRMKDTLMNVPIRNKIQFRKLEKLFKANPYFTALRSSIDVPTVPGLMFHFCPLSVEKAKTMTLEADPEEGHENYTLINLGRYHWMEQIIQDLNSCLPHLLPKNVIFQAWFLDQLQPFELVIANDQQKIVEKSDFHLNQEEDRLHKISGVIEPPESIRFSNMPYDVWECIIGKGGEPEPFVIADDDSPVHENSTMDMRKAHIIGTLIRSLKKPDSGKGEPTSDAQSAKTAHF